MCHRLATALFGLVTSPAVLVAASGDGAGGDVALQTAAMPPCVPPRPSAQGPQAVWEISSPCLLTCDSANCTYAFDQVVVKSGATLQFDETRMSIELRARLLKVYGNLTAGTAERSYGSRLTIVLTGKNEDQDDPQVPKIDFDKLVYSKVLMTYPGSSLNLHGIPKIPWIKLAKTAPVDSRTLELVEPPLGWTAGDRVIVPSTGVVYGDESETVTVQSISGTTVTIEELLKYEHYAGYADPRLNGEVGILSRNIRIIGEVDDADHADCLGLLAGPLNSQTAMMNIRSRCYGGHTVLLEASDVVMANVEMSRMGQATRLARYPVHFHLAGESNSSVTNMSIWETYQRCVTVHGTWGVDVTGVVCHYTHGHAFYLEDGIEFNNRFVGNLAVKVRKGPMVCTDAGSNIGPSAFWITNPNNTFVGNLAVDVWGGDAGGIGYWIISSGDPAVTDANYLSSAYWTSEYAAQSAGAVESFGPSFRRFMRDASVPAWIVKQQQARTPLKEFRNNGVRSSHRGVHIDGYVSSSVPGALGNEQHPEEAISVFDDTDGTCNYFEMNDRPISYAEGMRAYMPVKFTYDSDGQATSFEPAYSTIESMHISRCAEAWWSRAGRLNITNGLFVSNWIGLTNHYPAGDWCPGDGIASNPGLANLIVDSLFIGHEASFESQLCKYGARLATAAETPSGIRQYDGGFWLFNTRWTGMDAVDCAGPDASVDSLPYAMVSSRFLDCNYKVPTQLHKSWPLGAHPHDQSSQWGWALPANGSAQAQSLVSFKGQSMCGFATGGVVDMTGTLDPVHATEVAVGYYAYPLEVVDAGAKAAQALYLRKASELEHGASYHNSPIDSTAGALVQSQGWYFQAIANPDYAHICSYCDYTTGSSCPSAPPPSPAPTSPTQAQPSAALRGSR